VTEGNTLDSIELFKGLEPSERDDIAKRCRWKRYDNGQQIIAKSDSTNDVYLVVLGRVRAASYSVSGREVIYRDIEAGQIFGEFSAIDDAPRSADVNAVGECLIASMSAEHFLAVVNSHPAVSAAMLKGFTQLARSLTERVFEFSALAVKSRIHTELLRMAGENKTGDNSARLDPAPTHAEIAALVSTSREAVTREFNDLGRSGILEQHGRTLLVHDVSRLNALVREALGEAF